MLLKSLQNFIFTLHPSVTHPFMKWLQGIWVGDTFSLGSVEYIYVMELLQLKVFKCYIPLATSTPSTQILASNTISTGRNQRCQNYGWTRVGAGQTELDERFVSPESRVLKKKRYRVMYKDTQECGFKKFMNSHNDK